MSEREDDLRDVIATIRKALDEGASFRELVNLGRRASATLEFRLTDEMIGLHPADTALLEELMDLRRKIWDRMGINKPAPNEPVDEPDETGEQPEPDREVDVPVPALPAVENTITVQRFELGPSTDYDAIVSRQLRTGAPFEIWRVHDMRWEADGLSHALSEIRGTPQYAHLVRGIGKLIADPDPDVREQALFLVADRDGAASCADLILAQVEPEERPLFNLPQSDDPSMTLDEKLLTCLGYFVDARYRGALDLAKRELLRSRYNAHGLVDAVRNRDRKWLEDHLAAITQSSARLGELVARRLRQ